MYILTLFAFLAGLVTIISPCVLPVLPIILSGSITGGKRRPLGIIVGFIFSFTVFTAFSFWIVQQLGLSSHILRNIAIAALIIFGASLFFPPLHNVFLSWGHHVSARWKTKEPEDGFLGGIVIGLSLGIFWTPCVGPILATVIALAATSTITIQAVLITVAYALGTALPMFGIMIGGRKFAQQNTWIKARTTQIQKLFGVLMVLLGTGLYYNIDQDVQIWGARYLPNPMIVTDIEENGIVHESLEQLEKEAELDPPETDTDSVTETHIIPETETDSITETTPVLDPKALLYPKAANPDFAGATKWLNSEPLTLETLKGKVVMVDFWTFGCYNCINTLPYMTEWDRKYRDQGYVTIGVHTPEFDYEKVEQSVLNAMKKHGIEYTVVQDNEFKIWRSYKNRYWPAKYLIDHEGYLRYFHFGEGRYEETEAMIVELLEEAKSET